MFNNSKINTMENQKKRFIPAPPRTPNTPGTPKTPNTPGTPNTPDVGNMPGKSPQMSAGTSAAKLPKMPGMSKMPKMPNIGLERFKMAGFMEGQMNHHKKHHLDANGNCNPHLKKEGFKFMKRFMD
jgi:hypothetical protein